VSTLAERGVRRVYGIVGDSLNPVTDAIRRTGTIDWIQVRNEEAGAFAAGADAELTGKLAVCAGELRARQSAPCRGGVGRVGRPPRHLCRFW
jgi:thiamine pyrophosphate-dependent acetolactate synthase large subunit-like protein